MRWGAEPARGRVDRVVDRVDGVDLEGRGLGGGPLPGMVDGARPDEVLAVGADADVLVEDAVRRGGPLPPKPTPVEDWRRRKRWCASPAASGRRSPRRAASSASARTPGAGCRRASRRRRRDAGRAPVGRTRTRPARRSRRGWRPGRARRTSRDARPARPGPRSYRPAEQSVAHTVTPVVGRFVPSEMLVTASARKPSPR